MQQAYTSAKTSAGVERGYLSHTLARLDAFLRSEPSRERQTARTIKKTRRANRTRLGINACGG